jgi:predicted Kef-type K+ transport protein
MEGHDAGLLSTLGVSLVFAFLGGAAARVVRLPPLVVSPLARMRAAGEHFRLKRNPCC